MKKSNVNSDKSAPYRTMGYERVEAPKKPKNVPGATKTTSSGIDLRDKRG